MTNFEFARYTKSLKAVDFLEMPNPNDETRNPNE